MSSSQSGFTSPRKAGRLKFYWVADGWLIPLGSFNPITASINWNADFNSEEITKMAPATAKTTAAIDVFALISKGLMDLANRKQLQSAIYSKIPEMQRNMPYRGGILLHGLYDVSKIDPIYQNLISLYVVKSGYSPFGIAQDVQNERAYSTTPANINKRISIFIWVTR